MNANPAGLACFKVLDLPFNFVDGRGLDSIPQLLVSSRPSYFRSYLCLSYVLSNMLKVEPVSCFAFKKVEMVVRKKNTNENFDFKNSRDSIYIFTG